MRVGARARPESSRFRAKARASRIVCSRPSIEYGAGEWYGLRVLTQNEPVIYAHLSLPIVVEIPRLLPRIRGTPCVGTRKQTRRHVDLVATMAKCRLRDAVAAEGSQ